MLQSLQNKIDRAESISTSEAYWLYFNASDEQLSRWATQVRDRFHPVGEATYLIMAIVNFTNICVARCDYCAFYRLPRQAGTYTLSFEEACAKIDTLIGLGGTMVGFNGGFNPKLGIKDYAELFRNIRARYPQVTFYEMTVAEFMFACKNSRTSYEDGAKILRDHGTTWVTGGGAEILDEDFRLRHSPYKYTVADYFEAQRVLLECGLKSTATMVIGFDEPIEERLNHLRSLRTFQNNTHNKLPSFLCWTYKPYNNALGGREVSPKEYLRWLAICRIYLDNIPHVRTSVMTQNEDAMQGLRFGANDFDLPVEDQVTQMAGGTISLNFGPLLDRARSEGYVPRLRSALC